MFYRAPSDPRVGTRNGTDALGRAAPDNLCCRLAAFGAGLWG